MHRQVDILLVLQWLVPCTMRAFAAQPGLVGNRLDRLYSDIALLAGRDQGIEVFSIVGLLHGDIVVREQDRVKVEAFEAAPVRGSNLQAMPGDADCPYQSLLFGLDGSIDSAARAQRRVPFDRIDQVMQLPQVHVIDVHAFQRALQFLFRLLRCASIGLRCYVEL